MMEFQMKKNQKKDEEEEEKKRRMRLRGELPKEEEEEEEDWDPEPILACNYLLVVSLLQHIEISRINVEFFFSQLNPVFSSIISFF